MKKLAKYIGALGFGIIATGAMTSCDNEEFLTVPEYELFPTEFMFQGDN